MFYGAITPNQQQKRLEWKWKSVLCSVRFNLIWLISYNHPFTTKSSSNREDQWTTKKQQQHTRYSIDPFPFRFGTQGYRTTGTPAEGITANGCWGCLESLISLQFCTCCVIIRIRWSFFRYWNNLKYFFYELEVFIMLVGGKIVDIGWWMFLLFFFLTWLLAITSGYGR